MNREFWQEFYALIENATEESLLSHREYLVSLYAKLKSSDLRPEIKRAIRLIDEEMLARVESMAARRVER
ncbi:hypothetical protein [Acidihalobacter prosperus]|uniref:hypothetical protein n=1 Tax=Acidihalobacter prosperus TaxID=160660 RepID=UPI0011AB6E15|nr:hypothetical protein [Acidihalobacter prosperus]